MLFISVYAFIILRWWWWRWCRGGRFFTFFVYFFLRARILPLFCWTRAIASRGGNLAKNSAAAAAASALSRNLALGGWGLSAAESSSEDNDPRALIISHLAPTTKNRLFRVCVFSSFFSIFFYLRPEKITMLSFETGFFFFTLYYTLGYIRVFLCIPRLRVCVCVYIIQVSGTLYVILMPI